MKIKRKKIPDEIEARVMFKSNRECCVCNKRGDHIHHLKDKSDNSFENLALLCFDCHDEASKTGSLRKKLSAKTIVEFRNHKYKEIETKRENSLKQFNSSIIQLTTEDLLTASKNALIILELENIKEEYFAADWYKRADILGRIRKFSNHKNLRVTVDIFSFLSMAADQTRGGMTSEVASSILYDILDFFPAFDDDQNQNDKIVELSNECVNIAFNICYDTAIYLKNYDVAMYGLTIFKFIYKEAKRKKLKGLIDEINSKYDELESTLQRPERNDLGDALELVRIFRQDIEDGTLAFPPLPEHLMKLVYQNRIGQK